MIIIGFQSDKLRNFILDTEATRILYSTLLLHFDFLLIYMVVGRQNRSRNKAYWDS
jgi:hypothetical protein